jgi:hypothetical protein
MCCRRRSASFSESSELYRGPEAFGDEGAACRGDGARPRAKRARGKPWPHCRTAGTVTFSETQTRVISARTLPSQRFGDDVSKPVGRLSRNAVLVSCGLLLSVRFSCAHQDDEPGHSIGKVSTKGDLIVMELDQGALGKANLFDLTGHTLRFTPEGSRDRVENGPLHWDSDFGPELTGAEARLHKFAFPFSGKSWNAFLILTAKPLVE